MDQEQLFIGLISGTSMDGIDASLLRREGPNCELLATTTVSYPKPLRRALLDACFGPCSCDTLGELDIAVGEAFAHAALDLLAISGHAAQQITAIGSHGQTIRHRPELGYSLQIGDASRIAQGTNITTVADFRRADLAAGGEGAPLAPIFHHAVFSSSHETRAVLNLGGIANLTLLHPHRPVIAFDVGPANTLLDSLAREKIAAPYDRNGNFAASGHIHENLLSQLLSDPWFSRSPPKSTGPELFNSAWLYRHNAARSISNEDLAATVTELTAVSISTEFQRLKAAPARVYCCGGGVHNRYLMSRIAFNLPSSEVTTTAELRIDPDYVEASCFAWLAAETLARRPGNLPSVTGARHAVVLGAIYSS